MLLLAVAACYPPACGQSRPRTGSVGACAQVLSGVATTFSPGASPPGTHGRPLSRTAARYPRLTRPLRPRSGTLKAAAMPLTCRGMCAASVRSEGVRSDPVITHPERVLTPRCSVMIGRVGRQGPDGGTTLKPARLAACAGLPAQPPETARQQEERRRHKCGGPPRCRLCADEPDTPAPVAAGHRAPAEVSGTRARWRAMRTTASAGTGRRRRGLRGGGQPHRSA